MESTLLRDVTEKISGGFDSESFKAKAFKTCSRQLKEYEDLLSKQADIMSKYLKEKESHQTLLENKDKLVEASTTQEGLVTEKYSYEKFQTALRKRQVEISASETALETLQLMRRKVEQKMPGAKQRLTTALANFFSARTSAISEDANIKLKECLAVITEFTDTCREVCTEAGVSYPIADPRIRPTVDPEIKRML